MVLKVMPCTPSASNPLSYNVNKVERGDATLLGVRNIPSTDYGDINRTLLYRESLATNTRKPSIHIMISADKNEGENLTNGQALELIEKEMNAVNLGNQPYVVFKHEDTDKDHFHIVSTKILPNGKSVLWNGIGKRMINELMRHEKKYGYIAGRNLHEVKLRMGKGEGVYRMVKNKFEKLLAGSNYYSYKEFRAYARDCKLDIRKRQSKSVDRKILIVNRLGEDGKRIGRPVYLIGNEAERLQVVIDNNLHEYIDGYNSVFPPMASGDDSLISLKNNINGLMKDTKDAGITISNDTTEINEKLSNAWNQFDILHTDGKKAKDRAARIKAISGKILLINPIVGLTVMLLAGIANDIIRISVTTKKRRLLNKVEAIRAEISRLQKRKEQLTITSNERIQKSLNDTQMIKEYHDGLQSVDKVIRDYHVDMQQGDSPCTNPTPAPAAEELSVIRIDQSNWRTVTLPKGISISQDQEKRLIVNVWYGGQVMRENGGYLVKMKDNRWSYYDDEAYHLLTPTSNTNSHLEKKKNTSKCKKNKP